MPINELILLLCSSKSETRSNNTLNSGIISKIEEKNDFLHGTIGLEILSEESSNFHVHSHCTENDGEVIIRMIEDILSLNERCLTHDLCTDFVMWQTICREQRNLLTSSNGSHAIDSRNTSLNHFLRVNSRVWINWLTIDVLEFLSEHWWTFINRSTRTIEHSSKHFLCNRHLQCFTSELAMSIQTVDTISSFENLCQNKYYISQYFLA